MKNDKALITVITLSYYSPDLLGCIDSVLEQTYSNIQYIIVDDGTDNFDSEAMNEYIARNQKGNIKDVIIVVNEENQGIVKAFNIGLKLAKGEIIFNVAGDDQFVDKDVLSDWVNAFKTSGALIVTAYRRVYNQSLDREIGFAPLRSEVKLIKKYGSQPKKLFEKIAAKNIIFGCCTAQTKKAYELYGLRDEKYRLIDDHPYYLNLLRKGQTIEFFDRAVVKYRQGGISYTSNVDKMYYSDADNIIKNEALPYVSNPKKVKKEYDKWKQDIVWSSKVAAFKENEKNYQDKKIKIFVNRVIFALKNPGRVLKKTIDIIKREQIKKLNKKDDC